MIMHNELDLASYLSRVGLSVPPTPTATGLAELQLAHVTHIPFENLDVILGRPIRLDLASLQAKLVQDHRGGYCFEQNLLFAAVLERLGFKVTRLAARVRYRTTRVLARTHMLLLVETEDGNRISDVGFGGSGPLLPMLLEPQVEQQQFNWVYRLTENDGKWVLQYQQSNEWQDIYIFTLERQEMADYEMANYYISTHPDSPFTSTLTVQLATPEARFALRNREFTVDRGTNHDTQIISESELPDLLRTVFGLNIPPDTSFVTRTVGHQT